MRDESKFGSVFRRSINDSEGKRRAAARNAMSDRAFAIKLPRAENARTKLRVDSREIGNAINLAAYVIDNTKRFSHSVSLFLSFPPLYLFLPSLARSFVSFATSKDLTVQI